VSSPRAGIAPRGDAESSQDRPRNAPKRWNRSRVHRPPKPEVAAFDSCVARYQRTSWISAHFVTATPRRCWAASGRGMPARRRWRGRRRTDWERARREARDTGQASLLVLDEIQKVRGWSETVKALWDDDRATRAAVRPVLLGSSAMLVQQGLTESLAGRFGAWFQVGTPARAGLRLHRCAAPAV
jgi:hypothetical protein